MKTVFIAVVFSTCCMLPGLAQTTSPSTSPMNQGAPPEQSTMPSNTPTQGDSMMSHANPTTANLTGQAIFNAKGK